MAFETADFIGDWSQRMQEETPVAIEATVAPKAVEKRKLKPRYEKNICGYILKKAMRAFVSDSYRNVAVEMCLKHGASFEDGQKLCLARVESVYGPSHLRLLLVPTGREEVAIKQAITQFLEWFLAERYTRHLILEGKMDNKEKYILYKNAFFPKEIARFKRMTQQFIQAHP